MPLKDSFSASEKTLTLDDDGAGKEPRYCQASTINATLEAVAKGVDRNLLVMVTGAGKTSIGSPSSSS